MSAGFYSCLKYDQFGARCFSSKSLSTCHNFFMILWYWLSRRVSLTFRSPRSRQLLHGQWTLTTVATVMPSSHRRRGQDKTVLSCPRLRCEMSWRQFPTVFSSPQYIGDRTDWKCLRCERVCKLVLTQFRNMTSQFADTANEVIKWPNGNYRIQYYEQSILKQLRLITFCKIYAYKVYFMYLLIREYDVTNLVANWKLGQDKTKLNSHRISRLDNTAESWTCSVSKFTVANSLHLLWVHFTPQTRTRQDKTVLSCPRL